MSADRPKFTRDKFLRGAALLTAFPQVPQAQPPETDSIGIPDDRLTKAKVRNIFASCAAADTLWMLVEDQVRNTTPNASQLTTIEPDNKVRDTIDRVINRRGLSSQPLRQNINALAKSISVHQVVQGQLLDDGRIKFELTTPRLPFYARGIMTSPTDAARVMVFGDDGLVNTGGGRFKRQQRVASSTDGVTWIDRSQNQAPGQSVHLLGRVSDNGKWGFVADFEEEGSYLKYSAVNMRNSEIRQLHDVDDSTPRELFITTPRVQDGGRNYVSYGINLKTQNVTRTEFSPEAADPKTAVKSWPMPVLSNPSIVWKDYIRDGKLRLIHNAVDFTTKNSSSPADLLWVTNYKANSSGGHIFIQLALKKHGLIPSEPSYTAITGLEIDDQTDELFATVVNVDMKTHNLRSHLVSMPIDLQDRAQILSDPSLGWPENKPVPQNMTILRKGHQRFLVVVFDDQVVTKNLNAPASPWQTFKI